MINPKDPSVNPLEMGEQLLNGYQEFLKALSLDSVPNAKGEIKPKFSKDIASKINGHFNDYFNAGGTFYNEKKFYPEAYEAFMIYGNMPSKSFASKRGQIHSRLSSEHSILQCRNLSLRRKQP